MKCQHRAAAGMMKEATEKESPNKDNLSSSYCCGASFICDALQHNFV